MRSDHPPPPDPGEDIIGDRRSLVVIGLGAVFVACAVFGALRLVVQLATGRLTPWWGNAVAALGVAALYLWFRAAPDKRSSVAVHGTAALATVALLIPAAYGMTSSKWWLSLVGFSVLLMGRRREAIVWSVITAALVPLTALVEPLFHLPNAAGEPAPERAMAGLFYVALLLGVTGAFRRVAQRRARQLADTAASLDRANRVKSRFLSHMSHEIRTPLHGVIAMTDVARGGEASATVHEQIDAAQQSARVLLGLLNNVLDVTRAEADALELDRRPFPLHATLTEVLRPFASQARAKGITLEAHSSPGVKEARIGDRARLGQVVLNLVGNALKFTREGRITVALRPDLGGDDRVAIDVTDTGPGIAPEKLEAIFEPFAQANVADSRVHGGVGLGLAIVRELSRCMDGAASVQSAPGRGATFTVRLRLPCAEGATAGPQDLLPPVREASQPPALRAARSLRVLACEDNPVNQRALRAMLEHLGHQVVIVGDGHAGLAALAGGRFDVLLTDVEMPGLDGVELTRTIRDQERARGGPRLPIVGATAHVSEGERHRLLDAGMDEHLPKPFALADLAGTLARAAAFSTAQEPAAETPVLDERILGELVVVFGDDRAALVDLAERFRVDGVQFVKDLGAASERGDHVALARLAHSLKGSAASLGLARVAALARELEARPAHTAALADGALAREIERAAAALSAFVQARGA